MKLHIGQIIKAEVEYKRLTQKEFGALIHRNEKTVPDIYERDTMSIDLLIAISVALKKDFLKFFYEEEPMNSLRDDDEARLKVELKELIDQRDRLQREITLNESIVVVQKEALSIAKEVISMYKAK